MRYTFPMARYHHAHARIPKTTPLAVTLEAWAFVGILCFAVWLYRSGLFVEWLHWSAETAPILGGFFAGAAYSTFATLPLATVALLSLGGTTTVSPLAIALYAALGAMLVDLTIIKGLRSPLALFLVSSVLGRDSAFLKNRVMRSFSARIGALVVGCVLVAVPLPTDEVGLMFIGASGFPGIVIAPLIFLADYVGILSLLLAGQYFL
jgi:hypothetical protein